MSSVFDISEFYFVFIFLMLFNVVKWTSNTAIDLLLVNDMVDLCS